jgi:hypothetical protein
MEGDKIAKADRASVTVALIDGSRLSLSESSSMVIYRASTIASSSPTLLKRKRRDIEPHTTAHKEAITG